MLSKSQIKEVKEQLLKQIESWPESQRENAKEQINSLSDEELVEFLTKNKLINVAENSEESSNANNPFRLIIEGKIPSIKIGENTEAIAVLEINPISKAHTIVIPKKPLKSEQSEKIPKKILELANEISDKIKLIFSPKKLNITSSEMIGEIIIQILPVYDDETLDSKRKKATQEELKKIQEKINSYEKILDERNKKDSEELDKKPVLKKLPKAPVRRP
ncbi:MAG: HIT domain-containing protein [Nanoarchaeota archaeon]